MGAYRQGGEGRKRPLLGQEAGDLTLYSTLSRTSSHLLPLSLSPCLFTPATYHQAGAKAWTDMAAKLNDTIRRQEAERDSLRASHQSSMPHGYHPATSAVAGTSGSDSGGGAGAPLLLVPPTPAPASALPLSPDASPERSGNQRLASKPLAEWGEYFEEMLMEEREEEGEGGESCSSASGRLKSADEDLPQSSLPMCSFDPVSECSAVGNGGRGVGVGTGGGGREWRRLSSASLMQPQARLQMEVQALSVNRTGCMQLIARRWRSG